MLSGGFFNNFIQSGRKQIALKAKIYTIGIRFFERNTGKGISIILSCFCPTSANNGVPQKFPEEMMMEKLLVVVVI